MSKRLVFEPQDIAKMYNDQFLEYSNFAYQDFAWNYLEKPLLDKVLATLPPKNLKILDVGCGNGRTLRYLIDHKIPKNNILGVDISHKMLSVAKRIAPGIKTIESDLCEFRAKEKFDLIICIHVLHYLNRKKLKKVISNFYHLLNPNGVIFFLITHPVRTTRHNLSEYFRRSWIVDHTPWGTNSPLFLRPICDLINETIKAGFTIKSVEEPEVPIKAKEADPVNYLKYAGSPSRFAIVAKK